MSTHASRSSSVPRNASASARAAGSPRPARNTVGPQELCPTPWRRAPGRARSPRSRSRWRSGRLDGSEVFADRCLDLGDRRSECPDVLREHGRRDLHQREAADPARRAPRPWVGGLGRRPPPAGRRVLARRAGLQGRSASRRGAGAGRSPGGSGPSASPAAGRPSSRAGCPASMTSPPRSNAATPIPERCPRPSRRASSRMGAGRPAARDAASATARATWVPAPNPAWTGIVSTSRTAIVPSPRPRRSRMPATGSFAAAAVPGRQGRPLPCSAAARG